MSLEMQKLRFGDFLVDTCEKVLLRNEKPISITPKAFLLLQTLLENNGHIVAKDDLMKTVWADSFVEDGNLTFTIRLLRKALDDDAQNPRFIETVARRGYRFIHELEQVNSDKEPQIAKTHSPRVEKAFGGHRTNVRYISTAAAVLLITAIAFGGWFIRNNYATEFSIFSESFSAEKLSTNGKVHNVVISPDGTSVIYTNASGGKTSVWIRELDSANNVEIIPPSDFFYYGLAVSTDGNFLYFVRRPKGNEQQGDIYRISKFGGIPVKIISEAQGWISLSPDGSKISFVRCYYSDDEFCSLWIADSADGKSERKIVSSSRPIRIAAHKISPDGKTIAFAAGQSENQANEFGLSEVSIENGTERMITNEKFFNIKALDWLPDGKDLLITASRIPNKNFLIRHVSNATGDALPLTRDFETYVNLSLDKTASRLVSTRVTQNFRLQLFSFDNPSKKRVLTDATEAAFAPDGTIVFVTLMAGNYELWSIKSDGTGHRQLTNNPANDGRPIVSNDNKFIYFASNRSGEVHVWRMNNDGSDQKQITQKDGGYPLFISADGRRIYYKHGRTAKLWRVFADGSEERSILDKSKSSFAVSPDESLIAYSEKQGDERRVNVVSQTDGRTVKTFKTALEKSIIIEIKWMPDGKSLVYALTDSEFESNTLWRQPFNSEKPEKITDLGNEQISEGGGVAISPDGKSFIVSQGNWLHDAVLLKGLK